MALAAHEALDDAQGVVQRLGHRGEAVGRARGVGDDRVLGRVIVLVVDTHDDGDVLVGGRCRDDDLLGATGDVGLGLGRVGEEAGGLDDDVGSDGGPVQGGGVALGPGLERRAVVRDRVVVIRDVALETTEDRVVLEQRGERLVVGEVVDPDDLDVGARGQNGPEEVAADAAEAVDAYANSHVIAFHMDGVWLPTSVAAHLPPPTYWIGFPGSRLEVPVDSDV